MENASSQFEIYEKFDSEDKLWSSIEKRLEYRLELSRKKEAVEEKLRNVISKKYDTLCLQAVSMDSLENVVSVCCNSLFDLRGKFTECGEEIAVVHGELQKLIDKQTILTSAIQLMRDLIDLLMVFERLENEDDIVERSSLLKDALRLENNKDLQKLEILQNSLQTLPHLRAEMIEKGEQLFQIGLKEKDAFSVCSALMTFKNLDIVEGEVQQYCDSLVKELNAALDKISLKVTPAGDDGKARHTPGTVLFPSLSVSAVQSNLWSNLEYIFQLFARLNSEAEFLLTVKGTNMRTASSGQFVKELCRRLVFTLCDKLAEILRTKLASDTVLIHALRDDCPRFVQSLNSTFAIADDGPTSTKSTGPYAIIRNAFASLEIAYNSFCLNRLVESVHKTFQSEIYPNNHLAVDVMQTVDEIIEPSCVDVQLLQQVQYFLSLGFSWAWISVSKAVNLFAAKCERLIRVDSLATQVIDSPNHAQIRNCHLVNNMNHLSNELSCLLGKNTSKNAPAIANIIQDSLRHLDTVMEQAIRPLCQSVESAIAAILNTMHQEDFTALIHRKKSASLYMRELQRNIVKLMNLDFQAFLARINKDYLSLYECADLMNNFRKQLAVKTCDQFLLHVSLLRIQDDDHRLMLVADFAELEFALTPLCCNLSSLGLSYQRLQCFRPLLLKKPDEVVQLRSEWQDILPASSILHLLISMSHSDLPSPNDSMRWTVCRYVEWLETHPDEMDRLLFLSGSLEAYAKSTVAADKAEYVPTYPLIVDLLHEFLGGISS
ncbi:Conserved oligomeric Golgi complex subunit 5 [Trichinella spiralis]|uniref:Conserved oligomeric Golgi complex subunit 5 n=1 Tax=Trichinella spiralis TaxID=6334 RepID=A0A0V1BBV1_TRISP|nr:Conserved oligomeric Golgi complex subunit 5 [Trichinella spiralis]